MNSENLEIKLEEQMSKIEYDLGIVESNTIEDIIRVATLQARIVEIDNTLFSFRDLAGRQLNKDKNGELMARYRSNKVRMLNLVAEFENYTGIKFPHKLRCNQ